MIPFIVAAVCVIAFWYGIYRLGRHCDEYVGMSAFFATIASAVFAALVAIPIAILSSKCGSGLAPYYSAGVRDGYITKVSEKGIIWKTIEADLQVGSGEMAALQKPWKFSVPKSNTGLVALVHSSMGKKVRVSYNEWLIMPHRIGESGYEAGTIILK